jgi:hypothetical protein
MWWFLPDKYHQPSWLPTRHKSADHGSGGMQPAPPIPTLEQLRRGTPWCWVVCDANDVAGRAATVEPINC